MSYFLKKVLPVFVYFVLGIQFNSLCKNDWNYGEIVLTTGEKIEGEIHYNPFLDIVIARYDSTIKSFTPIKVTSFSYYDEHFEMLRKYASLDFQSFSNSYKSRVFFEVVLEGPVMLLYKDCGDGFTKNYHSANEYPFEFIGSLISGNSHYAYVNDKFISLKKFRNELLPLLKAKYNTEISQFIIANALRVKDLDNQISIVDYFNHLSDPNYVYGKLESYFTYTE